MHISKIPSDVIKVILQQAAADPWDINPWKEQLQLLAVCHNWRQLVMPTVYNTAKIICSSNEPGKFEHDNLQLIIDGHAARFIQRIHVCFSGRADFGALVDSLIERLSSESACWKNIQSLSVRVRVSCPLTNASELSNDDKILVAAIVSKFQYLFPNITGLTLFGFPPVFHSVFYGCLVDAYASQLLHLYSNERLQITVPRLSDHLQSLHFRFDSHLQYRIPIVNSESLKMLYLDKLPNNYAWFEFAGGVGTNQIHFSHLKKLEVSYSRIDEEATTSNFFGSRRVKIRLPGLKILKVSNLVGSNQFFRYARLPKTLSEVSLTGSVSDIADFAYSSVTCIERLSLSLSRSQLQPLPDEFTQATNKIFTEIKLLDISILTLFKVSDNINISNVSWPNLQAITITDHVNASLLLKLLPKVPNLITITVQDIGVDIEPSELSIPAPDSLVKLAPIDSHLSILVVKSAMRATVPEPMTHLLKYVILRLHNVQMFNFKPLSRGHLAGFVEEYKLAYPHLAKLVDW